VKRSRSRACRRRAHLRAFPQTEETPLSEPVLFRAEARIAILTLNRPAKLNAIDYATADALMAWLDRIEIDGAIGAVILAGAGGRAFSAGGDIPEFAGSVRLGPQRAVRDFARRGQAMTARIEAFPKPVIAAVGGLAYGGGCEIVEAAHLAVAGDRAVFAKPEIKLGMPPTFGGTQRLARLAGRKRALELLLTGEPFGAARALELGLVNRVVPHETLMDAAHELARAAIRHSPLAIAAILTATTRGLNLPIAEGLLVESEQFAKIVPSEDIREGLDAWIEGRAPVFVGR
jgi:enoyl-CoA hydratase